MPSHLTCRVLSSLALSGWLLTPASAQSPGHVLSQTKLSATQGGLPALTTLYDWNVFGVSIEDIGDLDGDGVVDLAVGAFHDHDGGPRTGAVYICFLNADGSLKSGQKINETHGNLPVDFDDGDHFGTSIANLGDLDGDGVVDISVGAWHDADGGVRRGALYNLFLNSDGTVKTFNKISQTQGGFTGLLEDHDHLGTSVDTIGDIDGDGVVDLVVGAGGDHIESVPGDVWILRLNPDGTVKANTKIFEGEGGFTGDLDNGDDFGTGVTGLGDLDGDGIGDIAIGAHGDDDGGDSRGATWICFLNSDGTVKSHTKLASGINGVPALDDGDWFGRAVECLGDIDADGHIELAVGASLDDDGGTDRGAVYIFGLAPDGTADSSKKLSMSAGGFAGALLDGDQFGSSIAMIGDLNGDGTRDFAIGAPWDDDGGFNPQGDTGAVWVCTNTGAATAPFVDLGQHLNGSTRPRLIGEGTLQPASPLSIELRDAAPSALAGLVLGVAEINAGFKGGVLVPNPDVLLMFPATTALGTLDIDTTWPGGIAAGLPFFLQFWVQDAGGPVGFSASNALRAVTG